MKRLMLYGVAGILIGAASWAALRSDSTSGQSGASTAVASTNAGVESVSLSDYAREAWRKSQRTLERILELENQKRSLPERSWWKYDRGEAEQAVEKLLGEVAHSLELSALTECRRQYAEAEQAIRETEQVLADDREKSATAPAHRGWKLWRKTKADYEEEIAGLRASIQRKEAEKQALLETLRKEYERIGIQLTERQLRFYLASVSGDEIVALSALYQNVRDLNGMLEQAVRECPDNFDVSRRYYGLHVVLVRSVVQAHTSVLGRIDQQYLPKIGALEGQVHEVVSNTVQLCQQASASDRAALDRNRRAQQATLEAAELYRQHLEDLRARVRSSLEKVQWRHSVSRNTYDTVVAASGLLAEMNASMTDISLLQGMLLPELLPVESELLADKLQEITAKLR